MSAPQSAIYGRVPPCVISKAREDLPCLQRVKRARRNRRRMGVCPLCHFEGARRFTLLAKGKTSAPQSAAYGRMPMATCCRKRQLFSCRLPSASERRNLWKNSARVLYSLFGNADCIPPSRGGAKTRLKACVVLPCLQGVKRARRNRRHMGASPWQFVAESVSFFAADYFAAATPPLRSG